MKKPVLSVCIPTFNRAKLLQMSLFVLEEEMRFLGEDVELVVSDNGSTDETADVVRAAQARLPIVYRRLPANRGWLYNIVTVVTDIAKGTYCWVLGDDDLVRPGALAKMLEIIDKHPGVPAIFVNHTYEPSSERENYKHVLRLPPTFDSARLQCSDTSERLEEKWENIVFCAQAPALFNAVVSHVFLREIWIRQRPTLGRLDLQQRNITLTYEIVFPHVHLLASELVGKPVYYVGYPYVMFFVGFQEFLGIWPEHLFTFVLRIADQLERRGGLAAAVQHYRDHIFKTGGDNFHTLLFRQRKARAKGGDWTTWKFKPEDQWSLWRLTRRHWRNREYRNMARYAIKREWIHWRCLSISKIRGVLRRLSFLRRSKKIDVGSSL